MADSLSALRQRIQEGNLALDKTQKEKLKAASDLIGRLSVTSVPVVTSPAEAESLPNSPIARPSISSVTDKRMSVNDMLKAVRATTTQPIKPRLSARAPLPSSPSSSESSSSSSSSSAATADPRNMLRRGQAVHRLFQSLSRLEIPSEIAVKRKVLVRWRASNPSTFRARLMRRVILIVAFLKRRVCLAKKDAIDRMIVSAQSVARASQASEMPTKQRSATQPYALRAMHGLGLLTRVMHDIVRRAVTKSFFDALRGTRKRQMEIAFLKAAIDEIDFRIERIRY